jgi:hypothetical protein
MELMGFSDTPSGRGAFDAYVRQRQWEPRDIRLTGNIVAESRDLRSRLEAAVLLQHPKAGPEGLDYAPYAPALRWDGGIEAILSIVVLELKISRFEICSTSRARRVTAARRQVALVAEALGQPNQSVGLMMGISESAVRQLRKSARSEERAMARRLAETLCRDAA